MFCLFVGGPIGGGRQWLAWLHPDDAVGLALDALDRDAYDGAVNAVAPSPARMKHFARQLGRALDRPLWMPVPGFALKAVMGEMGALVLESKRAVPRAAQRAGYTFRRPDLGAARSAAVTDAATT